MRILHTSDLHLGAAMGGVSFIDGQREFAGKLVKIAADEKADALIVAGDVYDRAAPPAQAMALYSDLMTELCVGCGIKVFVIAGNHDGATRLAVCGELLSRAGLTVAGSIKDGIKTVEMGGCGIHLLPFFSIEEARYMHADAQIENYGDALNAVLDGIRSRFVPGRKNSLVAHLFVSGADVTGSGRPAVLGGAGLVGTQALHCFDYVALGHLHKAQSLTGNIRYSGSPVKLSFSEWGQQKSVTLIDTDSMDIREIPVSASRDMRVVSGDYEAVLAAAENDPRPDDYIKVVLDDEHAHLGLFDIFLNCYPNLLELDGVPYSMEDGASSLSVSEVTALSPRELMLRFYRESANGEEPAEKLISAFDRAVRETLGGGRE